MIDIPISWIINTKWAMLFLAKESQIIDGPLPCVRDLVHREYHPKVVWVLEITHSPTLTIHMDRTLCFPLLLVVRLLSNLQIIYFESTRYMITIFFCALYRYRFVHDYCNESYEFEYDIEWFCKMVVLNYFILWFPFTDFIK